MFLKRPQHRKFEYQPRYYDSEKDPTQKFKQRMEVERKSHQRKKRPVVFWAVLVILIVYIYLYLSGAIR
jgi:hypothetical protein